MRRTTLLALLGGIVLMVVAVACSSSDPDVSSGPTSPPGTGTTIPIANSMMTTIPASDIVTGDTLIDQTYLSTSVTGHELVAGSEITMSFTADTVSINAGCNTMNGTYSLEGGALKVGQDLQMTMMGCPEDLMAQDTWLAGFLQAGPTITATGRGVALEHDGVIVELEPEASGGAGGSEGAAGLVGPTWTVHTFVTGDVASSLPAGVDAPTFTFAADGTVAVFTGCNNGSTAYEATDGGEITFEPMMMTLRACEDPNGQTTEVAITTLVNEGTVAFSFSGGDLTLTGIDGAVTASPA